MGERVELTGGGLVPTRFEVSASAIRKSLLRGKALAKEHNFEPDQI